MTCNASALWEENYSDAAPLCLGKGSLTGRLNAGFTVSQDCTILVERANWIPDKYQFTSISLELLTFS